MAMTRGDAFDVLQRCKLSGSEDFHTLNSSQVDALLVEADRLKYRKPKNANGSRGRYFYARLQRAIRVRFFAGFIRKGGA